MMIWLTTIKTTETFNFYWILKNQLIVYYSTRQVRIYLLDLVAQSKHTLMHHANHIVLNMKNTSMFSEWIFTLIQSLRILVSLFQTICSPFYINFDFIKDWPFCLMTLKLRKTKWIFFHLTVISVSTTSVDQFLLVSLSSLLSFCKLFFAFASMRAFIICHIGVLTKGFNSLVIS